jgi:hypothetical protein
MTEELYGVVEIIPIPTQSMYGGVTNNYLWYIDYLFSFQAEQGKLESNTKWYAKYSHMIEYLAQNQIEHIRSIGELSRTLSQMSDQMREENLRQFEERGRVYDKTSQAFGDYMLNIDR